MEKENKNAFVEYKVTLQDSEPASAQGKKDLETKLIDFLKLDANQVKELVGSMPVILKKGITKEEANKFAHVLRELGALVYVEKDIDENQAQNLEQSSSSYKTYKSPMFIATAACLIGLMLGSFFLQSSKEPGLAIDGESIANMIVDIKEKRKKQEKKKLDKKSKKVAWYGKKYKSPVALTIQIIEDDNYPVAARIQFATESPGELSPEELIRGVKSVWLKQGEALFQNIEKPSDRLEAEVKMYFLKQGNNERFVAKAILEKIDVKNTNEEEGKKAVEHRKYKFSIQHQPKPQFLGEPFFLEYLPEKGYSIVLNQEIDLEIDKDKENTNISKVLEQGIESKKKKKSKKKGKKELEDQK